MRWVILRVRMENIGANVVDDCCEWEGLRIGDRCGCGRWLQMGQL